MSRSSSQNTYVQMRSKDHEELAKETIMKRDEEDSTFAIMTTAIEEAPSCSRLTNVCVNCIDRFDRSIWI